MAAIVLAAAVSSAATSLGAGAFAAALAGGVGGFAGGFIDRAIFATHTKQQGPRLNNLQVQVSTYGTSIPIIYGLARIAGNVIWSLPLQEHATTTTQSAGGKGGGSSVSTTNYTYTATLAVAICEGPITEVARVWADAELIDITQPANGSYTLYYGDESQLPDPVMASFFPSGRCPAHRGMAYVVIENFPLADFGNRIPNFTFEVRRVMRLPGDLEDKITDVTLIPGAGEYVYDTVVQSKTTGSLNANGALVQSGKTETINQHNLSGKADTLVALDDLQKVLPNIQWVSVVINWFADSANPASLTIKPAVEFNNTVGAVAPDEWAVDVFTRATAHQIQVFGDGTPTFGGTPTDKSIVRLCQELKNRGLKVMLYPQLQVDTTTPQAKPWRGHIVPTSVSEVTNFFTSTYGYNYFINHYANLVVGGVALKSVIDAFMLGSELVGLTNYMSSSGVFPAVSQLVSLAATVKAALGSGVKLTYGADWSEYHSVNGWYHLDPLWASSNIDAVSVDCYFPLTPDLPQAQIDYNAVYNGWTSGEGWDYYWDGTRTTKTNYGSATFAWKNVKNWWTTMHTNPDSTTTSWTARMKPLWFTELGFPSVDGCSNQPNVFYDPHSVDSLFPRGSFGQVDFTAQRQALNASLDFLTAQNTTEPNLVPRRFIWTWDARPYPFWPDLQQVWADYQDWRTGHWIEGKVGQSNLGQIVAALCAKVGLTSGMIDVTRLTNAVDGYIVGSRQTVRACLEELANAYFFDCTESDGILKFIKRGGVSAATIDISQLIPKGNSSDALTIARTQELDLPREVDVVYLSSTKDYQSGTQVAQRQTTNAVNALTMSLSLVFSDQDAKTIADVSLYNAWAGRTGFQFTLPPKYAQMEPSDIIQITSGPITYAMRITGTKLSKNGMQDVTAVSEDVSAYQFYTPPGQNLNVSNLPPTISDSQLALLDLPAFPTDALTDATLRYSVAGIGSNWIGTAIYRSDDGGANFNLMQSVTLEGTIGSVLNNIPSGTTVTWDNFSTISVLLLFGQLQSVTDLAVLNGANACIIGNEVIQFANATLTAPNQYTLSRLLRGRLGTEWAVGSHTAGETFVLLNNAVLDQLMAASTFGVSKSYKPVTIGDTLANTAAQNFTYNAVALKPYSPVQIAGTRDGSGNLTINWLRRTRIGGDWRDGVDVPLSEESERYEVDIMSGVTVKRTITGLTTPTASYTAAQQVTDFGSAQSSVTVNVYQLSAKVGRGYAGNANV